MNRISHLFSEDEHNVLGPFSDEEALRLLMAYKKDPSDLPCPTCGPNTIEVLAFINPEIDPDGFAEIIEPEGEYAAALYCKECQKAIGIVAGSVQEQNRVRE